MFEQTAANSMQSLRAAVDCRISQLVILVYPLPLTVINSD